MSNIDQAAMAESFSQKIQIDELEKFGVDIGKNLGSLLEKWKTEEQKSKKSILRRISTKTKLFKFGRKKTLTEEDLEEMRERVEKVRFDIT